MKEETARAVADAIVAAAAIGAAVVILRTPPLRRLAFGLARTAITTAVPAWLAREVRQAWEQSKRSTANVNTLTAVRTTQDAPSSRQDSQGAGQKSEFDISASA